jgi:outer membrane protein
MKIDFLALTILLSISPAQASLKKIAKDFLENNAQVKVAESQVKLAALDLEAFELTRNTNLNFSSNFNENDLQAFSAFSARAFGGAFSQPIEQVSHSLVLNKGFEWGGNIAVENTYQEITVPGTPTVFGFTQGLTYTQNLGRDFFGKSFSLQKEQLTSNLAFTSANSEGTIQQSLLELVRSYYQAALNKSLVKLQEAAKLRAERRLALIKRRVRDGLREKVDRLQAEISLYRADENVKSAQQTFTSAVEALSTSVHRVVPADEIVGLSDDSFKMSESPVGKVDGNQNLKALKDQLMATEAGLDLADKALIPTVNLEVGARSNQFNVQTSNAFSDGVLGGPNNEFRLGLNLTWALGSQPEKVEKTRALVNHQTTKLRLEKLTSDVFQSEKSIKDQINLLSENLKSSTRRLELAQAALKEYNRLYARGRADLDQLIQAEETLINTEINHVQYLSQREILIHSLAFLYGDLRGFLLGQK